MAAWVVEGSEESAAPDVTLIVGGGPGISASCARLFARQGMRVAVAARNPEKPVLRELESVHNARVYSCDASDARSVDDLFEAVTGDLGAPALVVHNIDGRVPEYHPSNDHRDRSAFISSRRLLSELWLGTAPDICQGLHHS